MLTWAVTANGLHLYKDGKHIGTIPKGHFVRLVRSLLREIPDAD